MILFSIMLKENEELIEQYFALRSVSQNTRKIYRQALESWDISTKTPIQNAEKNALKKWFTKVSKEKSPATVEKYAQQLRTLYTFFLENSGMGKRKARAEAFDLFDIIPFSDLRQRTRKENKLRDKVVTPQEFQTLMNATDNIRLKALIATTYESGCRKGEIFSLRLKDISKNPDHWSITVEGKTGTRVVPLVKSLPYLRAWLQIHPQKDDENAPLFVAAKNGEVKPMNPQSFNTALRYLCEKTGIRYIHPHMLRHTRLTRLADEGLGEFQMKSFAGWTADSKMAAQYIHLTGRGHVNAVLLAEGVEAENGAPLVESKPLLEVTHCPNCGKKVDPGMVICPYCQFILDEKLGISKQDRIKALEAEVEEMRGQLQLLAQYFKNTVVEPAEKWTAKQR